MKLIEKKLEELYIVKDGTHDSPKYVSSVDGFPLITSKNLKNGYIDISNVDYISSEDYNKINSRSNVDFGDLLMPMIGSIGNPVLVNIAPEFAIKNVALFKKNVDDNSLEFLKHILNSSFFKKKLANDSKGGTQKFVSLGYLRKLKILIPEKIEDQNRTAEILTQTENLITQRKESILLLDELLKSTFLQMFGDPSFNQNKFPEGKIRDVVYEVKYGTGKPAEINGIYPYLRMNNITSNGYMDFSNLKYINLEKNEEPKYLVKKGDLLFNRTNSKELVGKTGIYNETSQMAIAGYLIRVRTNEKANPWFLWGYLNSLHGKKTLFSMCKSIVGMANINAQELQEIKIVIPPIDLQNKFAGIVEKVEAVKIDYENSLKELENMYGVLSQKAFNTEIVLNQENDNIKKKSNDVMAGQPNEDLNVEKYLIEIEASKNNKEKRDITNMSFAEYLEFPEELQISHEKWMFDFLGDDEFYQFLLKDGFKDTSFTLGDLETKFHNFFYHGGDMDFDNIKWKKIIFKFLEANPPLIQQFFDEKLALIKLKLTDEAFKA